MSKESIFGEEGTPKELNTETPSSEQNPNPSDNDAYGSILKSITRPDGSQMYNSVEQALKGLADTKDYVATIKQEKEELASKYDSMRSDYEKTKAAAEAIERLVPKQEQQAETPSAPAIDEGTLKNMFQSFLVETETNKTREQNEAQVKKALTEKFGSKAKESFDKVASDLNIDPVELSELARKSPTAVLKLFGSDVPKSTTSTTGSVNSEGLRPTPREDDAPKKSLLVGATAGDIKDGLLRAKQKVYEKHGIKI